MKLGVVAVAAALSTFTAGAAHAQWADLNGQYRCVENCLGPGFAFITMQGWDMNLVNEAGLPSRAWVDYPGHLWAENWREGAFFSPDGLTVQFDNGSVWHRNHSGTGGAGEKPLLTRRRKLRATTVMAGPVGPGHHFFVSMRA